MKLVQFDGTTVYGMAVRTDNATEQAGVHSKIGSVWQEFHKQVTPSLPPGTPLYGVYHEYESDLNGPYSMLAGSDQAKDGLLSVTIPAGTYAVFSGEGQMPQLVFDLWQEVWAHFGDSPAEQKRSYTVDFECYKSPTSMEIFIAVE